VTTATRPSKLMSDIQELLRDRGRVDRQVTYR
jgi:hypothetical protein